MLVTRRPRVAAGRALLGGGGGVLGGGLALGGRAERRGGLHQFAGELALLREQPVEEVERGGHGRLRRRQGGRARQVGPRRQLAGEGQGGQLLRGGVHGLDDLLDRVEGHLLALTDDAEHLLLHVPGHGGGHGYLLG